MHWIFFCSSSFKFNILFHPKSNFILKKFIIFQSLCTLILLILNICSFIDFFKICPYIWLWSCPALDSSNLMTFHYLILLKVRHEELIHELINLHTSWIKSKANGNHENTNQKWERKFFSHPPGSEPWPP